MASTVNSAPAANGPAGSNNLPPSSQNNGGARQSLRTNASLKGSEPGRRQSGSPVDGGQRRSNSQKAWTQGINPLTQKSSSQQNGNNSHIKSTPSPKPTASRESNTPEQHAHDRLVFLLTSFIGLPATVITKTGDTFNGIFSSSELQSSDSAFVLKMVHRGQLDPRANGLSDSASPFVGASPDYSMTFDLKDIADITVANVTTSEIMAKESNGPTTGFRTDTDISGSLAMRERNLQRWEPSSTDPSVDMHLESAQTGDWDQFEVNARLFGATTSYDENLYTTRINRNDPSYRRREAEAARIAREIEGTQTDNPHLREERGHAFEGDDHDEEDKYSGVRREEASFPPLQSGQPNTYTPPGRRPPVQQPPTISPAVSDPAIISAQLAKPDAAPKDSALSKPTASSETLTKTAAPSQSKAPEKKAAAPVSNAPTKRPGAAENATSNVETEVLDHFRQFANNEKMKMQERRRNQASHDRTVKLNELMKFSQNFKLATPVPKDLVPILAKDPGKQEQIIERAQRQADEKAATTKVGTPTTPPVEQKAGTVRAAAPRNETGTSAVPPSAPADRQNYSRGRQAFPPQGPHGGGRIQSQTFHGGRGTLGHRLADNYRQQKSALAGVPAPLPIQDVRVPPSGPSNDPKVQTPTSSKFNVRAMEFKPNPAASTFTPGGSGAAAASPQLSTRGRSVSRASTPSAFFGNKKPLPAAERPSLKDQCSPMERLRKEAEEQKDKDFTFNGGIPPPYRTAPTWDVAPGNQEKTFRDMFKTTPSLISPQSRSASNPNVPPHGQAHFHAQQSNQNATSTGGPLHGPPHLHQQQPTPHFDDPHRMQLSASTSHMFPSPRLPHAYPSPMGSHAQLAFGQPLPQFYANQGSQPGNMRQYPGGPQFANIQNGMTAPMMVQQPSSGPYMGVPQGMNAQYNPHMQMYSPNPTYAYPQHGGPPPQPHSGYPSPSRTAPMMMHQGSQPGQPPQPVMFMNPGQHGQPMYAPQQPGHASIVPPRGYPQQPHYASSPHQSQHYPPHQHRGPGNNYSPMPQMAPHVPAQTPPSAAAGPQSTETPEDTK
ncbi:putative PAB1 binding protein [Talaromyces proteolyticus]|uniref:PAB1 binding protein n=1 Tax=Talaromyces proteolyticus TaxID=1131652 RepID=A0AAD4KPT8_9EURO|nr:putative PAB1 binding protein [Talaromyces proteolyticus]KAH8693276.1 putative PAB1 binding protein [Talaromyces proteolyticus]